MAEVTGRIGDQDVALNNAATEATLKLLLQATLSANKQSLSTIQNLATKSGLSPQAVEAANKGLTQTSTNASKVGKVFESLGFVAGALSGTLGEAANLSKQLASGNAQVETVFASFAKIPGVVGMFFNQMQKLATVQTNYLNTYRDLSNSGANFSGSLTDMRLAASQTYLTLDQFASVVKNNTEAFSLMGGTVDQGVRSFAKLSNDFIKSPLGSEMLALGYNFQQINEGTAQYIAMTGGRTAEEMRNTKAISAASAEYLTQLDGLAQITGKTREQQAQALKEANQNAAIQQKLASMDEKQKAAYNRGLAEMEGKFGKAGRELYQAQMLGIPPQTEAAKQLAALSPKVAEASQGMADVAQRGGTAAETLRHSAEATEGASEAAKQFEGVAGALSFRGDATSQALMGLIGAANKAKQQGRETAEEELEQRAKIAEEQKKRQESQAAAAAESEKALKELGQEILAAFLPVMKALFPVINAAIQGFTAILTPVAKFAQLITGSETAMTLLKTTVGALTLAFLAYKAVQLGGTIVRGVGGIMSSGGVQGAIQGFRTGGIKGALTGGLAGAFQSGLGGAGGPLGSTPQNPMYVSVVAGGLAGGGGGAGDLVGKIAEKITGGGPGGGSILESIAGKMGGLSKILGPAAKVAGKLALPAAAAMSAYDAYKGFSADPSASFGGKLMNAGSSALSGLTFGLLGSSPEEIAAKTKKDTKTAEEKLADSQKEADEMTKSGQAELLESLGVSVDNLNTTMLEMLKYTKEMTENTKRTMDGVKSLNPNLFPS